LHLTYYSRANLSIEWLQNYSFIHWEEGRAERPQMSIKIGLTSDNKIGLTSNFHLKRIYYCQKKKKNVRIDFAVFVSFFSYLFLLNYHYNLFSSNFMTQKMLKLLKERRSKIMSDNFWLKNKLFLVCNILVRYFHNFYYYFTSNFLNMGWAKPPTYFWK